MNANKMLCKRRFFIFGANVFFYMRNVHMMHMSLFRDSIFTMRMSHAMVQMQHSSMMVLVHISNPWCRCLLVGMPWWLHNALVRPIMAFAYDICISHSLKWGKKKRKKEFKKMLEHFIRAQSYIAWHVASDICLLI